jgi:dipeptidase D
VTRNACADLHEASKPGALGAGDSLAVQTLASLEARDDLATRLEQEFDRELLDEATLRVQLRTTPEKWEVFRLLALEGLSGDEVARRVDMKVATVYVVRSKVQKMLQEEIRSRYEEPTAVIRGENVDALGGNAVTTECTAKIIDLLLEVPNGIQAWSQDIEGLVQTSLNLGAMGLDDTFHMTFAVRSSVNAEKWELLNKLKAIAEKYEADYSDTGDYPAWEYRKDSPLRDTMVETYRQMYEKEPEVVAIHAGLECGLLSEKLPGLDCVSIGPEMHDIHTSRERLGIASTERVWNYLQEVLKKL